MLNLIILMGRTTKDPESRKVGENTITNFDIAVDNLRKESDGSQSTSFFKVTCFGKVAENVRKFVRKGSKIAVQGSIQQRTYLVADSKRTTYDVIADSVEFLDPKPVEPTDPNPEEIPPFDDGVEEVKEEPKEPAFDPYTVKPLKPKANK